MDEGEDQDRGDDQRRHGCQQPPQDVGTHVVEEAVTVGARPRATAGPWRSLGYLLLFQNTGENTSRVSPWPSIDADAMSNWKTSPGLMTGTCSYIRA